jgi:Zn-dependent protease with chaperone function
VADRADDRVAASRRRLAIALGSAPGLVLGVVALAVLAAVGLPVVGAVVLVVVVAASAAWTWRRAPGAVLTLVDARPAPADAYPRVDNLLDGLCATMGLPRPELWVVDGAAPNAMAVGRDPASAAVVVTAGLQDALSVVQLEGVLAHELVHIKREDTALAGVAVATLAPLAGVLGTHRVADWVHGLAGRGRQFDADQRAAEVVRYPPGLGTALETMAASSQPPSAPTRGVAVSRWLWIDPLFGHREDDVEGNLDDTRVRAATLALR